MRLVLSLCAALVRLHPPRARRRYGSQMVAVVEESFRHARDAQGRLHACAVGLRSVAGLCLSLAGFWWDEARSVLTAPLRSLRDPRQSVRALLRTPAFTAAAVALLGLGVGTNTAMFATVHQTLLRPAPFPDPGRLVLVWGSNPSAGQVRDVISGSTFTDLRRDNVTLEAVAAVHESGVVLTGGSRPTVVPGLEVSVDFGLVTGLEPYLGRWFVASEATSVGEAAVMLGYDFWERHYGARAGVVGSRIATRTGPRTVVGILPRELSLPWTTDVLIPLSDDLLAEEPRTHFHYWLLGRLRPGASLAESDADLDAIFARIGEEDPGLSRWQARIESFHATVTEPVRPALAALQGAVGLLLLLTGANLANLLLVRGASRQGELAVRAALGAGRGRLVRQLLAEGALLGLGGAALGLVVAVAILAALPALAPETVTIAGSAASVRALRWGLSGWSVGFAVVLGVATGVLVAVPAAMRTSPVGVAEALRRASVRSTDPGGRVRRDALVVAELALATVLLVLTGLAGRSTAALLAVDSGVRPSNVLTLMAGDQQDATPAERTAFYRSLLATLEAVPGVTRVGLIDYLPFLGEDDFQGLTIAGRPPLPPGQGIREEWRRVSSGFFDAAGVRLVRGRTITPADEREAAPSVVLINEAFARKHFPGEDPLGHRVDVRHAAYGDAEIVGLVADVRERGPGEPAPPTFYSPYPAGPRPGMAVFARVEGDPARWIEPIQQAIWRVDADAPVYDVSALSDVLARSTGIERLLLSLISMLGAAALVLAALGVFGVTLYSVRVRRRELGIRIAIGASPGEVRRLVIGRGLTLAGAGLSLGAVGAVVAGRATASLWYGLGSFDAVSLGTAATVLLAATLAASWAPARAAQRTDPVAVLAVD